jgi:RNA polymerase sigma-70 factor (ECF subfamily)
VRRGRGRFATTRWSVVLAAADPRSPRLREALSSLCQTYWYPLYAYARRRGLSAEDAQDVTQGFFAKVLEKQTLGRVERRRGRFRSFLLASFRNFIADERQRAQAHKRGGPQPPISIDLHAAEHRYVLEPAHSKTPEKIFERRWAMTVLERTLERLRGEHLAAGRERIFERLADHLVGDRGAAPYAEAARELGLNEVSVRVAVHRMRKRYRTILLDEIAQTVDSEDELESELRQLLTALED